MQEMLKITGIRKSFSTLDVLKGVDLTVHKGAVSYTHLTLPTIA